MDLDVNFCPQFKAYVENIIQCLKGNGVEEKEEEITTQMKLAIEAFKENSNQMYQCPQFSKLLKLRLSDSGENQLNIYVGVGEKCNRKWFKINQKGFVDWPCKPNSEVSDSTQIKSETQIKFGSHRISTRPKHSRRPKQTKKTFFTLEQCLNRIFYLSCKSRSERSALRESYRDKLKRVTSRNAVSFDLGNDEFAVVYQTASTVQKGYKLVSNNFKKKENFLGQGMFGRVHSLRKYHKKGSKAVKIPFDTRLNVPRNSNSLIKQIQSCLFLRNIYGDKVPGLLSPPREITEGPLEFGIMNRAYGPNLASLKGKLDKKSIVEGFQGLLHGLSVMHDSIFGAQIHGRHIVFRGLIHRDIKPGNVVFDPARNQMVLIDFENPVFFQNGPFLKSLEGGIGSGSPRYIFSKDFMELCKTYKKLRNGIFTLEYDIQSVKAILRKTSSPLEDQKRYFKEMFTDLSQIKTVLNQLNLSQFDKDSIANMMPKIVEELEVAVSDVQLMLNFFMASDIAALGLTIIETVSEKHMTYAHPYNEGNSFKSLFGLTYFEKFDRYYLDSCLTSSGESGLKQIGEDYSEEFANLLRRMIDPEMSNRPSAEECKISLEKAFRLEPIKPSSKWKEYKEKYSP